MGSEDIKWVLQRGDDIVGTFGNRHEAVKHLLKMIKQTSEDLKNQAKIKSEFDYNIDHPRIQIYRIEIRPAYLGL